MLFYFIIRQNVCEKYTENLTTLILNDVSWDTFHKELVNSKAVVRYNQKICQKSLVESVVFRKPASHMSAYAVTMKAYACICS